MPWRCTAVSTPTPPAHLIPRDLSDRLRAIPEYDSKDDWDKLPQADIQFVAKHYPMITT